MKKALAAFDDITDESSLKDIALTSYLAKFSIKVEGEHQSVKPNYPKARHEKHEPKNWPGDGADAWC